MADSADDAQTQPPVPGQNYWQTGYPPPPPGQTSRYPPPPPGQASGYPPPPPGQAYGYPPPPTGQASGYPPPPPGQASGYPPPPPGQAYGYPPPPTGQASGYPPPPPGQASGYPPPPPGQAARFPPPPPGQASRYPPPPGQAARFPPPQSGQAPGYQMDFGSPPVQGKGTIVPTKNFDAEEDANTLNKAMKGLGFDEDAIINVLANRSNTQRQEIKRSFKMMFGKVLLDELKAELSGLVEELVIALLEITQDYDANCLRHAMKGAGSDIHVLLEIMCSRSNKEIEEIKNQYQKLYGRNLEKDIVSETSGDIKRFLVSLAKGERDEDETFDMAKVSTDAQELWQLDYKKWTSDGSAFIITMVSRSFPHLKAMIEEYEKIAKSTIEDCIRSNVQTALRENVLTIVQNAKDPATYYAEQLFKSMKGTGTDDATLIRIVVSRSEVDLAHIKKSFLNKYHKTLENMIDRDTSGDYKRLLMAILEQN